MAEITVVNSYALQDGDAFEEAVAALAARVRDEGHPGVLRYRFFRPTPKQGRAVVDYSGPEAWVGHHDCIMGWPEMAALRAAAELSEILLFGEITVPMRDWIDRMGVSARVLHMGEPVAGFHRQAVREWREGPPRPVIGASPIPR